MKLAIKTLCAVFALSVVQLKAGVGERFDTITFAAKEIQELTINASNSLHEYLLWYQREAGQASPAALADKIAKVEFDRSSGRKVIKYASQIRKLLTTLENWDHSSVNPEALTEMRANLRIIGIEAENIRDQYLPSLLAAYENGNDWNVFAQHVDELFNAFSLQFCKAVEIEHLVIQSKPHRVNVVISGRPEGNYRYIAKDWISGREYIARKNYDTGVYYFELPRSFYLFNGFHWGSDCILQDKSILIEEARNVELTLSCPINE